MLLKLPFMFVQLTPASLLLAVIASFGIMNRNQELTALKSSGISVYFLVKPALLAVDSIQTLTSADLPSAAGSISQVRESAARLVELAKQVFDQRSG